MFPNTLMSKKIVESVLYQNENVLIGMEIKKKLI